MSETKKVYAAICAVQQKLSEKGISKARAATIGSGNNGKVLYQFRGIDDVYNAISPLLAENKLCIMPRMLKRECVERKTSSGAALFYVTVESEFDFVSAEDCSVHTVKTFGEAMDSGDKATNKAMSAAYKYACLQTFAIPTEGDNDADATVHSDIAPTDWTDAHIAMREADDLRTLQGIFGNCYKQASAEAKAELKRTYDKRKSELEMKEAA